MAASNIAHELLKKIAHQNKFSDYSIEINPGSKPGDGFASELLRATISQKNGDKKLELMCKVAPSNKHHREQFNSDTLFSRETLFYTKLMPVFVKFQAEKNISTADKFLSYPKCFAAVANSEAEQFAIMLENLQPLGFTMWDKAKSARIENVRLTLRELGKFHGLSFAIKDQKPNEFVEVKQLTDVLCLIQESNKIVRDMFTACYDRAINSLKNEEHKTIMRHVKDNMLLYIKDCFNKEASDRFGVLCHGDCWNNNLLYRFNELGSAQEIRFLDWQIIRYASPATDLLYYLFSSTDKSLRDQEYDNLLALYYESLAKTVRLLGSNPDQLFTFENLKDELKRFGNFSLLMVPMIIEVSQAHSNEISKMDEMFNKAADGEGQINLITGLSGTGQQEYDRRINELLENIVNLGYFHQVN